MRNKKLKCLLIIDYLTEFAGTEKHLFNISAGLSPDKFSIRILSFETNRLMVEKFNRMGVHVLSLDLKKIYGIMAIPAFVRLISEIRSYNPDIVQTFHFKSDTFGVCAARIAGVSNIISSRRDTGDLKKKRQIGLNRLVNPMVKKYISVCNQVKKDINRTEKVPLSKIQTIYNGIDLSKYEAGNASKKKAKIKLGIKEDAFVVGTVCIFRPEKDVLLFLKAVAEMNKRVDNIVALIVGKGRERNNLQCFSEQNGLSAITIFPGYIQDPRDYIQAMDVACLTPKENEGLSNSILEKMAMGIPVIATNVGGNAELVMDGVTGTIIPPGDSQTLAEAIQKLYQNPALRSSMGQSARERVKNHFSLQKMIENMEKFYLSIILE